MRGARAVAAVLGAAIGAVMLAACAVPAEPTTTAQEADVASPAPDASSPAPAASPSTASSTTATASSAPSYGTAYAAALALTVKGRAPKTGYARELFGSGWVDVDRNGCDTRNDMLRLRLTGAVTSGACTVLAGDLDDPFTGEVIRFEKGGASEVDIDHMVALSDAWQKGAAQWPFAKRVAFANDPLNLEPVDAGENRAKGDGDAATWLPPAAGFRCEYVARQIAVKTKYEVWVTQAELDAMLRVLDACPTQELPGPGEQPVIAENTGGPAPTPVPEEPAETAETASGAAAQAPEPAPVTEAAEPELDPRFPYCKDLPAGYGPYYEGRDPEYAWYTDRDKDGVVCE